MELYNHIPGLLPRQRQRTTPSPNSLASGTELLEAVPAEREAAQSTETSVRTTRIVTIRRIWHNLAAAAQQICKVCTSTRHEVYIY